MHVPLYSLYISIHIFKYASYMTKHLLSKNLDSYLLKEYISLKHLYNLWPIEKNETLKRTRFSPFTPSSVEGCRA